MTLNPVAIDGIAPDKAYRGASGTLYRARIARQFPNEVRAAPNIDPAMIAPMRMHLAVSIAVIDEDGYVQRLGDKLRIADEPEWIIVSGGADLSALIDATIERMIDKAEVALVGMPDAVDYLAAEWGIDMTPPPPAMPVFTLPVTPRAMVAEDIFLPVDESDVAVSADAVEEGG